MLISVPIFFASTTEKTIDRILATLGIVEGMNGLEHARQSGR
jgi:hypothetical protein